jgi:uncharacterized membrane protein
MEWVVLALIVIFGPSVGTAIYLARKISRVESQMGRIEQEMLNLKKRVRDGAGAQMAAGPIPLAETSLPGRWEEVARSAPSEVPADVRSPLPIEAPTDASGSDDLGSELLDLLPPGRSKWKSPILADWESFMGVKLFAWVGGLALFLAITFFIKYSFENNLVPPQVRVALGFLAGVALVAGGLRLSLTRSLVTAQTLCATGILVLYADFFASHGFYQLIPSSLLTFFLMTLVTVTALLLAIRLNAPVVAILGLAGGFLTPVLLSTGVDNPLGLFGYLAILDAGLIALALRQRWQYLLLLAALGTVLMQIGWVAKFFVAGKIWVALSVFAGFTILFTLALGLAHRLRVAEKWTEAAGLLVPNASYGFLLYLLLSPYPSLAARPGVIFSFAFLVDLALLGQSSLRERLRRSGWASGAAVFLLLTIWTTGFLTVELLNWALAFYLVFSALHTMFPVVLRRFRPAIGPAWWSSLFPALSLILVMLFISSHSGVLPILVWPCVLLIDLIAIGLAITSGAILGILPVLVLTILAIALWIGRISAGLSSLSNLFMVIGSFAVIFFAVGIFASLRRESRPFEADQSEESAEGESWVTRLAGDRALLNALTPMLSATLPFLLLMMVVLRLPLANPSPVFGLGALLAVLLLGLVHFYRVDILAAVGMGCVLLVEYLWHLSHFDAAQPVLPLSWYLGFTALFMVFPFVFAERLENRIIPWATAALSGPAHFGLIYRTVSQAFPNPYMGIVPALMALPSLIALIWVLRRAPAGDRLRNALLALFGGASLFFVTLIFPVQFERQWITIGWALEGVALLWLFHRVQHPGLKPAGAGLLICAFLRLAVNPAVFTYYLRTSTPIFNWYLYAYGITAACLMAGGHLLASPHQRVLNVNVQAVLYSLGTVLSFLLLNIEIADYFSIGATLTFNLSGNLAQDMTYSLAWAAFAFVLFIIGVNRRIVPARYSGFCLLTATMLKLFLHDLWRLGGLYRIGALIGLAVVLILVSFVYQRFVVNRTTGERQPLTEDKE